MSFKENLKYYWELFRSMERADLARWDEERRQLRRAILRQQMRAMSRAMSRVSCAVSSVSRTVKESATRRGWSEQEVTR